MQTFTDFVRGASLAGLMTLGSMPAFRNVIGAGLSAVALLRRRR